MEKVHLKPSEAVFIFRRFFGGSFRPEVVNDANVGLVDMDVHVKFGDAGSNGSRDMQQRMLLFRPFFEFR